MIKVNIGANMNIIKLEVEGTTVSLLISLNASANACKLPKRPTTLGPLLRCMDAKTLRSITVKKATDNIIGNIIGTTFNHSILIKLNTNIKIMYLKNNKINFTINSICLFLTHIKTLFLNYVKYDQTNNNY